MTDRYVIDTSILMQAYIKDTLTKEVTSLLSSLDGDDSPELHVMEIGLAEAANVIWKHEVIFETITPDYAQRVIKNLRELPLHLHLAENHLQQALDIGRRQRLAIYDTLYIALAQKLEIPLITADSKQSKAANAEGVQIKSLVDSPVQ